jgi:hypothetical protein
MERLICLLPKNPDEEWERMSDQYKSSLWDIYPETQVCGVGENDTVIVDGARGASIKWSSFSKVTLITRLTYKRRFFMGMVTRSPWLFLIGVLLIAFSRPITSSSTTSGELGTTVGAGLMAPNMYLAGVGILVISILLFQLPAPFYIWHMYGGKVWGVEPCLFGIEGYVPLHVIEEKLFGLRLNRMSWSPYGSPLSRHRQGNPSHERRVQYPDAFETDEERAELLPPHANAAPVVDAVDTYPVEPIDPLSPCDTCRRQRGGACPNHETLASVVDKVRSPMGQMKVRHTNPSTFSSIDADVQFSGFHSH